jgi:hypothetical protein
MDLAEGATIFVGIEFGDSDAMLGCGIRGFLDIGCGLTMGILGD